jgi:hypothetical protein
MTFVVVDVDEKTECHLDIEYVDVLWLGGLTNFLQ